MNISIKGEFLCFNSNLTNMRPIVQIITTCLLLSQALFSSVYTTEQTNQNL